MGVGKGVEDEAPDITYSTMPNVLNSGVKMRSSDILKMAAATITTTGEDLSNLDIYSRAI